MLFGLSAALAALALSAVDWLLRVSTSWGGISDRTLLLACLLVGAIAVGWGVFDAVAQFALDREREAQRRATDPGLDALDRDLRETLREEDYGKFNTNIRTISLFPSLFDDYGVAIAYEQIEKILRSHPELRNRFFARFPSYEMTMEAYYGMTPRVRWRRIGAIRRLLAREQGRPELGPPGADRSVGHGA